MSFLKMFIAVTVVGSVALAGDPKSGVAALQKMMTKEGPPAIMKDAKVTVGGVTVPNIKFGKTPVVPKDPKTPNDALKAVTVSQGAGSAATIFVKDGNEFVRLSTTILDSKGNRVVGTKLAVDSPAYPFAQKGEGFCGEAKIVDYMYDTCYEPIRDANKEVIGLYLFGFKK